MPDENLTRYLTRMNITLDNILKQLKHQDESLPQPIRKEFFPLFFTIYAAGKETSGKWYFKDVETEDLKMDFDYEIESIYLETRERTYNPAIRLKINSQVYPNRLRYCSDQTDFKNWTPYEKQNYDWNRPFSFTFDSEYQSGWSHGVYPFKMIIKKPWTFNIQLYQTSANVKFHGLTIFGYKLHYLSKDVIESIEQVR